MGKERKNRDVITIGITPPELAELYELGVQKGYLHTCIEEPGLPEYEPADCEVLMQNDNGSYIVLGRDRMGNLAHGKGGAEGGTDCAAIDLVCGRLSGAGNTRKKGINNPIKTGPNPCQDAARIYITERGEVDHYFALPKGKTRPATNRSGVVIKSDHTRIIGRLGVKIFAGKAEFEGCGMEGERNSQGGWIREPQFIELIANYDDDLQPLVKGDNLVKALEDIYDEIADIRTILYNTHMQLAKLSAELMMVPGLLGPGLHSLLKHFIFAIEDILRGIGLKFKKINFTGIGDEDSKMPGGQELLSFDPKLDYVLSQHVFTT